MEPKERYDRQSSLTMVFTPSSPVRDADVFAGRMDQITDVLSAINQHGQHAIIYGERGVGKTSLANVLPIMYFRKGKPLPVTKIIADTNDTFQSLWYKVFEKAAFPKDFDQLPLLSSDDDMIEEGSKSSSFIEQFPADGGPSDVVNVLELFPDSAVVIIDEFDRVRGHETASAFADLVKQLSDSDSPVTLVLIGVADNISQLISEHASIERCTKQIHLPRMTLRELEEFVVQGFGKAGMEYDDKVPSSIGKLSQGFPHYAHSLGLNAGVEALRADRVRVEMDDVRKAVGTAKKDVQASIQNSYIKAVTSNRKNNLYERVLVACALADHNELGFFALSDVKKTLEEILGEPVDYPTFSSHVSKFCDLDHGKIIERTGTARRWKFRFVNPLMPPYVFLRGVESGLVPQGYSPF